MCVCVCVLVNKEIGRGERARARTYQHVDENVESHLVVLTGDFLVGGVNLEAASCAVVQFMNL